MSRHSLGSLRVSRHQAGSLACSRTCSHSPIADKMLPVEKVSEVESEVAAVALRLSSDGRGVIARWSCLCGHKNTHDFSCSTYWLQCERCGDRSRVILPERQ